MTKSKGLKTREYFYNIGDVLKNEKRNLKIIEKGRYTGKRAYKYKCYNCGFDGNTKYFNSIDKTFYTDKWITEKSLKNGAGCLCCANQIVVEGINDILTTDKWMVYELGMSLYDAKTHTSKSSDYAEFVCVNCKTIHKKRIVDVFNRKTISCICNDSYSKAHKYIYELLSQININFRQNIILDWCKFYNPYKQKEVLGEYDFVIEDMKLIIEVDGSFHRKNNTMNQQTKEESEFIDKEKDRLAREYRYNIVRLEYKDDEKDYLMNNFKNEILVKLNNIFCLKDVNWEKCYEQCLKSLIKDVCDYWNNKEEHETTKDLVKIFKISRSTIIQYLNQGNKLKLCHYNGSEEVIKALVKNNKNNMKKIKMYNIFKEYIGTFESLSEIQNISEDKFNQKLNCQCISEVLHNKKKQYKGFIFKYAEEGDSDR